jgi:hypothetical protein
VTSWQWAMWSLSNQHEFAPVPAGVLLSWQMWVCIGSGVVSVSAYADAQGAGCIAMGDEGEVAPTPAGRIASIYYLQVGAPVLHSLKPLNIVNADAGMGGVVARQAQRYLCP